MKYTEEQFLESVKDHTMDVLHDDGNGFRSIRFSNNGMQDGIFKITTWPGCLCINGDYGTYVFERCPDMFSFFRGGSGAGIFINPGYWGEKIQSISTPEGFKKFSYDLFEERITKYFNDYWEDMEDDNIKRDCWEDVKDNILHEAREGEIYAYSAVNNYSYDLSGDEYFRFDDFFDAGSTEEYTYQYIWCLYAIVWGIEQYDNKIGETNDSKK